LHHIAKSGDIIMVKLNRAKRRQLLWMLGSASFLTPLALPGMALAEDAADPAPAPSGGVTEIVVTATHRSENLQKVAISLQALSPDKLEQHQVSSFADYANMLPSVSFSTLGPGRSQPFFRGISVSGGQAPTVGVYLDEIPVSASGRTPDVHIYDVERVEALSGPQGTLFGASSLAGTLRIITNKPKLGKFEAGYDVQANKYGKGNAGGMVEGFVNLPVHDEIAVRLMGFYRHDGGYMDNAPATYHYTSIDYTINNAAIAKKNYNPVTEYGGRAGVLIEPAPDWTILPSITYQYLDAKGSFNEDPRFGDLTVHDFNPTYNKDSWYQASLTINGKIADFDVVSSTGYFRRKIRNANDYTYYSVTYDKLATADPADYLSYLKFRDKNGNIINPTQQYYGEQRQQKFTQELRVSVPKSWPFQMTAGGFYQFQKNKSDGNYYISGLSQATNIAGFSPAVLNDSYYLVQNDQHFKDGAAFAEANYNLLKNLKVTGGIRYFISDNGTYGFSGVWQSARSAGCWNTSASVIYNKFIESGRLTCINTSTHYHQTGETHKASVAWQFEPDKMAYFTYSTGFRPGGGNRIANSQPYKADTLANYEIGLKTTWHRNVRLNIAAYYEKWQGIQYSVVPFGFQGAGVTVNAGDARVYGIEYDAEWKLHGLTLSTSGAYNDAALSTNFCKLDPATRVTQLASCNTDAQIAAKKGTRLPRQPRFKMQASARYDLPLDKFDTFIQGTLFHQSSSTSDLDASNDALLGDTKGFSSVDFSIGAKKDNWTVEAFIQNAFDNRGILSKNTFCSIQYCSSSSRSFPIRPQFFGLKFGQRF
jgi:outer membrane receptor protein involved in Fe transport